MFTLALSWVLNHPTTADLAWRASVALAGAQESTEIRSQKSRKLQQWIDAQDGVRVRALARYSPFADDTEEP
jgi:hypothetical protein